MPNGSSCALPDRARRQGLATAQVDVDEPSPTCEDDESSRIGAGVRGTSVGHRELVDLGGHVPRVEVEHGDIPAVLEPGHTVSVGVDDADGAAVTSAREEPRLARGHLDESQTVVGADDEHLPAGGEPDRARLRHLGRGPDRQLVDLVTRRGHRAPAP